MRDTGPVGGILSDIYIYIYILYIYILFIYIIYVYI